MVSAVDDGVGKILNKLNELNIEGNTIVFYLSDNGGPEKHNGSDNGPLREGKGSLYEGGIHVPFAVQWPDVLPAGKKYDKPIISLDIFSTVVKYAGVKPKNKLDGVDLVPYLTGKDSSYPHDYLFWRKFDQKAYAVRNRDMKLVNANGENNEIYNLKNDIGETVPITDTLKLLDLLNKKDEWNSQMKDPVFLGLKQNKLYNQLHPKRFNLEKY
jgi:arylsulfatase A-like enzyme